MATISPETQRRLDILFRQEDRAEAARLLAEQCGNNLPFLENLDEQRLERFRFAALKLSGGDLSRLREAIDVAKTDWRDLLMAAGFGEDLRAQAFCFPPLRFVKRRISESRSTAAPNRGCSTHKDHKTLTCRKHRQKPSH